MLALNHWLGGAHSEELIQKVVCFKSDGSGVIQQFPR